MKLLVRQVLNSIFSFVVRSENERTARATKNVLVSFAARAVMMFVSFILVPLTLNYVGTTEFGIWITISTIITWFGFFDIGLGNGLRNKLAEALARDDIELARTYISSSYALLTIVSAVMFVLFLLIGNLLSWQQILNTDLLSESYLYRTVLMVFFFFCLGFCLKTLNSILEGMQLFWIKNVLGIISHLIVLLGLFLLVKLDDNGSLFYLCLVYGSQAAIGLFLGTLILFLGRLREFAPKIGYIDIRITLPLLNLGVWFFVNQLIYLVLSQSSIILVVQFFGPEDVTIFNLAKKYMTIISMLYIMVLTPFLTAFTEAFTKNEFEWIRKTMKSILWIWIFASFGTVVLIGGYRLFFQLWVDGKVMPGFNLIASLAVLSILEMLASTYTLFLNGVGIIRLQFYTLLGSALFFIPMVLILYKFRFGLVSLVLPSIFTSMGLAYIHRVQYNKILEQKAVGVWKR